MPQGASSAREKDVFRRPCPLQPADAGAEPVQYLSIAIEKSFLARIAEIVAEKVASWSDKELWNFTKYIGLKVQHGEKLSPMESALWKASELRQWRSIMSAFISSDEARTEYGDEDWRLAIVVSAYLSGYSGARIDDSPIPNKPGMAAANALATIMWAGKIGKDPVEAGTRWLTRMRARSDLSPFASSLLGLLNQSAGRPKRRD